MGTFAWIAVVLGALAVIAIVLIVIAGRGGRLPTVGILRMARLSRLAAGISASWLGAKIRRLFAGKEKRPRIDEATRERNAKRLADTMGNMKGAFMKLGQMLSFVTDALPKEYQSSLAMLQAEAPPLDFPTIRDALESELGKPLERAFADFDEEPIAAASIGQVHRATLPDGRVVAVKVQYPGIAKAINSDLANVGVLYRMIGLMYPSLDPRPVVEELRERIGEELNYVHEAQNQENFQRLYRGHPFLSNSGGCQGVLDRAHPHLRIHRRQTVLGSRRVASGATKPLRRNPLSIRFRNDPSVPSVQRRSAPRQLPV